MMSAGIALRFVTVVTAVLRPDAGSVLAGLVWPRIPQLDREGLACTWR